MNDSPRNTIRTFPARTYSRTIAGKTFCVYCLQNGHWRSANSVTVTGARGLPRTMPCCGIPSSSAFVDAVSLARLSAVGPESDLVSPIAIATTMAATTAQAPNSQRRRLRRSLSSSTQGNVATLPGVDLGPVEIRVLGCLIEKQRTTPDAYPLTLNGLRLACNQSTNRDPVVEYDEHEIRAALERLARRRFVRLASGHTTRATKYRHLLDDTLSLSDADLALLGVLMLRGPQTPGELKQRTERLHRFAGLQAIEDGLDSLAERDLVQRLDRRPGQKEERYRHLMAAEQDDEDAAEPNPQSPAPSPPALEARVDALEQQVSELRAQLSDLRQQLGG
jgi:uncharacterized protein